MPTKVKERPRVYLNNVHLKGFKSIEDLTIDFQKGLNILIGKNGAGKSNFMEFVNTIIGLTENSKALFRFAKLEFISNDGHTFILETEKERDSHKKSAQDNLFEQPSLSKRFLIDNKIAANDFDNPDGKKIIVFNGKNIRYRGISLGLLGRMGYQNIYPIFLEYSLPKNLSFIDLPSSLKIDSDYFEWIFPETLDFIAHLFWGIEGLYDDDPENIEFISKEDILRHLKIQDNIKDNLKRYTAIEDVKFNNNINLYKDEKSITIENIKLDFKVNDNWLPWSQLSDGTQRLFYIISEVTYNTGVILIEEPELGIHPHQFHLLMNFLKEQSEDKQIILSTHAPKALDHLSQTELDNVLIAYYDLKKGTQIRHLTKKEQEKAKRYMKEVGFFSDYWTHSDLE